MKLDSTTENKVNKTRRARMEEALAMIIGGKELTGRPVSMGSQGWGTWPEDREFDGPACAVGLGMLWHTLGVGSDTRPLVYLTKHTDFSRVFWAGVSDGFEESTPNNRNMSNNILGLEDDRLMSDDYVDGHQVGKAAAAALIE